MPLISLSLVAPGDTITAQRTNDEGSNFNLLDARTGGDPGATGRILYSDTDTTADWVELNSIVAALSDASAPSSDSAGVETLLGWIANRLKAITGKSSWRTAPSANIDTLIANTATAQSTADSAASTASGKIDQAQGDARYHRRDFTTTSDLGLRHLTASGSVTAAGVNATSMQRGGQNLWGPDNDGSGSGLDADSVDGIQGSNLPTLSGGGNFTTAPTINSNAIGLVAAGSYSGNNGAARQITTGFACKAVMIQSTSSIALYLIQSTSQAARVGAGTLDITTAVKLHSSNGFIVSSGAGEANTSGITYVYIAWG
jgi:hypothetical protein